MGSGSTPLSPEELAVYDWQLTVPGFGEEGQRRLKGATVLISRAGGLGGLVAYELAAAGVGRLLIAHGGNLKPADLNRQLLQTHDHIGKPRIASIVRRLRELNPRCDVVGIGENISDTNVAGLVAQADVVVDAAPLFSERQRMNATAMRLGKPMVECAMYAMEAHVTTFIPGRTGCLRCLLPEDPADWQRRFPVFGAVSGVAACIGAVEAIKLLSGMGETLAGSLLSMDLRTMRFRRIALARDPDCPVCSHAAAAG